MRGLVQLARPKQWIKNSFVLAPLLFSAEFMQPASAARALVAVLLFCGASSAVYVINDIRDVESDRRHPGKSRSRPLAAGDVSLQAALALLAGLSVATLLGGLFAPPVLPMLAAYVVLNLAYTFVLKDLPIVDVFGVAIGYVVRVYGGAQAIAVPVSGWMFITVLCLALYLTFVKRRQELGMNGSDSRRVLERYSLRLLDGCAGVSAAASFVFYVAYVALANPRLLFTIPVVVFGLWRYWYATDRSVEGDSPTDVVLADPWLLATVAVWIGGCAWAMWPGEPY